MCYYDGVRVKREDYILLTKEAELIAEYDNQMQSGFEYSSWPVVAAKKEHTVCELAHWEFVPFWYKNMKEVEEGRKKYTTLNAKGENLLTSKIYSEAAHTRRCLVLSSGFYEWRHYKGKAYPYHITMPGKKLFYMAGVWQPWTDKETGETFDTFAIVTTEANELMAQVHNKKKRMPTVLTDDMAKEWMNPKLTEKEIQELATSHPNVPLQAKTIIRNFREALNPQEPFEYSELPPLQVA
jgi:putative SOS response-associated peptidase YedK